MPDQSQILDVLDSVKVPGKDEGIVAAGMVAGVQILDGGQVVFAIEVNPEAGGALEDLRQEAERVVAALDGVGKVTAVLTAEKVATAQAANDTRTGVPDPHGVNKNPPLTLPVRKIIAVASGKGGVGKSTISAAIAQNLAKNSQLKVGLLDADIYGPSQPKLMGLEGYKPEFTDEKKIIPPVSPVGDLGVRVMSIGFMVDAEKALVWRGPMVQSALYQLFRDVEWGTEEEPLDVLIVDMPPGTGDAQLTLAQKVPVDGAIIVSTPQDLALADARKGIEMFNAVDVPILGLIENMSTHICSACGHEEHIFGHGGVREEAEKLGVPFLGEIPLSMDIRAKADAGEVIEMNSEIAGKVLECIRS